MPLKHPLRFTSITLSQSPSFILSKRLSLTMPALFTSTSTLPNFSADFFTASSKAVISETSIGAANAVPSFSSISETIFSRSFTVLLVQVTLMPLSANFLAIARPIPREAPVMNAVFTLGKGQLLYLIKPLYASCCKGTIYAAI